ncbi:MAG TPA: ElyC/SanA/YdcF family protein, partial [Geminicoccaceae bacterium]
IATEDTSRHTLENLLRYRAAFGGGGRVVLVTSRAHLARAGLMARDLGIEHELCAAEPVWRATPAALASALAEAAFTHWYVVGRAFARLTRNRRMLARIGG